MTPERRAFLVKSYARSLGFDDAGITHLDPPPHAEVLQQWLDAGRAGTMRYMHHQARRRMEPATIVPGATRAVVVAKNYYRPDPPDPPAGDATGRVARYARGRDYHEAVGQPLERLADYVRTLGGGSTIARPYVDHGPVPERELAQRAGLGWIGKNTMLVDPRRGSYLFLAAVLTDLDLAVDSPFQADRCGTCRRCLDACPTDAFPAPRVLDARRCISYLTIEHRGEIDPALRGAMGDWIFGCDVCQEVCPWNERFASPAGDEMLDPDPDLARLDLGQLAAMSDEEFDRRYGWTALERPGPVGMRRNARIARANRESAWQTSPTR